MKVEIIGIGCDIVEISRIEKAQKKEGFLRILTDKEKQICKQFNDRRKIEWLAGRFAAKEAIYKAISSYGNYVLNDIEILQDENGAPICINLPFSIQISISHENTHAIAYAIALKKE